MLFTLSAVERLYTRQIRTMAGSAVDTIIIGAGWSGAVAAQALTKAGRSVLVLEARDRVGGRAQTFKSGSGHAGIDIGCSWIHGYNEGNPAREIAKDQGVTAHLPKPAAGPIYGPDGLIPEAEASALRSSLGETLSSAHLQAKSSSSIDPGTPLASLVQPTPFARTLEVGLGVPLERASLKWAGWESGFGGSDAAPEGGYEALVSKVLSSSGAQVKLGQEVTEIAQLESGDVQVTTSAGERFTARTGLVTIPLGVLKTMPPSFTPALTERKQDAIDRVHVGTLEKLLLSYDTAWWPESATTGSFTFLPTRESSNEGSTDPREILESATLVVASFAGPSLPNPQPTLLIYLSATPASRLAAAKLSNESIASAAHALIAERVGVPSAPRPVYSALTNWGTDRYSRGATTTPNVISTANEHERTPLDFLELGKPVWAGRLGFAGEHTDPDHRGSVAGAVVSGQREALRIQRYLGLLDIQAHA